MFNWSSKYFCHKRLSVSFLQIKGQQINKKKIFIPSIDFGKLCEVLWLRHLFGFVTYSHARVALRILVFNDFRLVRHSSVSLRRLNECVKDMTNWVLTRLKMIFFHASFQLHNCPRHKESFFLFSLFFTSFASRLLSSHVTRKTKPFNAILLKLSLSFFLLLTSLLSSLEVQFCFHSLLLFFSFFSPSCHLLIGSMTLKLFTH